MVPSLGKKLSVFIALAPAVYAGPLTTGFPFTALNRIEWSTWKGFFGVLDFIPLMRWAYNYCPAKIFVSKPIPNSSREQKADGLGNVGIVSLIRGYQSERVGLMYSIMFAFLFSWTDTNW
jgi:hypothetical protein